jgi:hypothetical protein
VNSEPSGPESEARLTTQRTQLQASDSKWHSQIHDLIVVSVRDARLKDWRKPSSKPLEAATLGGVFQAIRKNRNFGTMLQMV